jgi:hypothetical protein
VNQLAPRGREVDLLLDAGKRLVDAQQASIAKNSRTELDTSSPPERGAASPRRRRHPRRRSAPRRSPGCGTLRSAATGAEGRELLARGRLEEDLSETGWDIVTTLTPAAGRKKGPSQAGARTSRRRSGAAEATRKLGAEQARRRSAQGGAAARLEDAHGSLCRRGRLTSVRRELERLERRQ